MNDGTFNETGEDIVQPFGHLLSVRVGLSAEVRHKSVGALTRLLAHTLALRDLYKKAHWQTYGVTFYQLHLLYDKHADEQAAIADELAERIQMLGGVCLALAADVVQESRIARAPRGRESTRPQLERLVEGHSMIIGEARDLARTAAEVGDDGTNDLIIGRIIRGNEQQSWFIAEHLEYQRATR
jgi:starvation-inducible DNA-binding protein